MDLSSKLCLPPSLNPSFSDQSHLFFYACPFPSRLKPSFQSHLRTQVASSSLLSQCVAQLVSHTAREPAASIPSELALLKELSDLKAQVKLKKKEIKNLAKQRKKAEKHKLLKAKGGSSSSSSSNSSSSESSDGEREAVNMRLLKKELSRKAGAARLGMPTKGELCRSFPDVSCTVIPLRKEEGGVTHDTDLENTLAYDGLVRAYRDESSAGQPCCTLGKDCGLEAASVQAISGNIRVCVGGKCKKAGSEELLSSLKAKIPGWVDVHATPCKCMGRCGSAINVKVLKHDTNPQHHSHVRVDDAGLILSHHFGIGPPASGLPSFSSPRLSSSSSVLTAQV